ncbi:hypothetical protein WJR50_33280 [Catalinimonas sp. 4WD22]|uniref:hypothetical protein n=1 Tax=Catalinimonas locisalis TaxID=3133978 RepID=UPI003100D47E
MKYAFLTVLLFCLFGLLEVQAQNQEQQNQNNAPDTYQSGFDNPAMKKMFVQTVQMMAESTPKYYETSDELTRIAKLNKKYYDTLVEAGFTEE